MGDYCRGFGFDGTIEDIIRAGREFGQRMKEMGREMGHEAGSYDFESRFERAFNHGPAGHCFRGQFYFYPPANIYTARDGSMILEFALSGIDENDVKVEFQGDYLVLSAKAASRETEADEGGYYRRGFRPRNIDRQKYFVPAADYLQAEAKATFKNGVLTVTVPSKVSETEGIKVTIVKEGA
jgi:HSP20 family molecular chaperone IbpA